MDSYNNTSNESQPDDRNNFVPITDPFAIPTQPSTPINQVPSPIAWPPQSPVPATNPSPTPFQDLLAEAMARASSNSSDNNNHHGIDLNQAPDQEPQQVVLGLPAPTLQEREENTFRARARQVADANDPVVMFMRYRQMVLLAAIGQPGQNPVFFPDDAAPGAFHPVAPPPSQVLMPHPFIENYFNRREVTVGNPFSLVRGDGLNQIEDVMVVDGDDHAAMRLDVEEMTYEELLELEESIGSVNSGLTEVAIHSNMQHHIYGSSALASTSRNDPCCICQQEFANGEDVSTLHCGHSYHSNCIKEWLFIKNSCPICKRTAIPI